MENLLYQVNVPITSTILDVMKEIHLKYGHFYSQQILNWNNIVLNDPLQTLKSLGIKNDANLCLTMESAPDLKLILRRVDNSTYCEQILPANETLDGLKTKVNETLALTSEEQIIFNEGNEISRGTLEENGLSNGDVVDVKSKETSARTSLFGLVALNVFLATLSSIMSCYYLNNKNSNQQDKAGPYMNLYILYLENVMYELKISMSSTIADLKKQIHCQQGHFYRRQILHWNNRVLDNSLKSVKTHGIKNNDRLCLTMEPPSDMKILLRRDENSTYCEETVSSVETLDALKVKINDLFSIPPEKQNIFLDDEELLTGTLEESGVGHGDVIEIRIKKMSRRIFPTSYPHSLDESTNPIKRATHVYITAPILFTGMYLSMMWLDYVDKTKEFLSQKSKSNSAGREITLYIFYSDNKMYKVKISTTGRIIDLKKQIHSSFGHHYRRQVLNMDNVELGDPLQTMKSIGLQNNDKLYLTMEAPSQIRLKFRLSENSTYCEQTLSAAETMNELKAKVYNWFPMALQEQMICFGDTELLDGTLEDHRVNNGDIIDVRRKETWRRTLTIRFNHWWVEYTNSTAHTPWIYLVAPVFFLRTFLSMMWLYYLLATIVYLLKCLLKQHGEDLYVTVQMFYLGDFPYDLKVSINSTILDVKELIQRKYGLYYRRQILNWNNIVLDDPYETVRNLGIGNNDRIHLSMVAPSEIKLLFRRDDNSTFCEQTMSSDETIDGLKIKLNEWLHIPPEEQRVFYEDKEMLSGTLEESEVQNGAFLDVRRKEPRRRRFGWINSSILMTRN